MLTLAAVVGGYALAGHLHVSGPLAMVVAGLIIGNCGRDQGMSDTTRQYVDMFWELIDEILNAVLFVLIGLEVLLFRFAGPLAGAVAVLVTCWRGYSAWEFRWPLCAGYSGCRPAPGAC